MSISFKCERCKKKVKAPDDAGGKWGSCPHCEHKCYIPLPPDPNEEELTLIPVDEADETTYNKMMRETHNLTQNILHETASIEDGPGEGAKISEKELIKYVIMYLRLMAGGELEQAEKLAGKFMSSRVAVKAILQKMVRAERPEPELVEVAPAVLNGLIRSLITKLE